MPGERASVCTNTPKNVSASRYCFYTRIKGGISSLDSRVLSFFFIGHKLHIGRRLHNSKDAILIEILLTRSAYCKSINCQQ